MTDKIQQEKPEAFEQSYISMWGYGDDNDANTSLFEKDERGQYVYGHVSESWAVWLACSEQYESEILRLKDHARFLERAASSKAIGALIGQINQHE